MMGTKAYLIPEEVQQLEEAGEYLRDRLLIRLLFRLGCRISEALGIAVGDIDFDQGTVTIEHLKVRLKLSCPDCSTRLSKKARFCPGCGQKIEKTIAEEKEHRRVRTLPIDADTLEMIRDYIDHGGPVSSDGKQLLFGIGRWRAWQIVKECAIKAGLGDLVYSESGKSHHVSPHRLRDAFAILAVKKDDSGDGLRLLQEHLGHQSITTTMRYRKVAGAEHKEWYEELWKEV
jgi:integrase/recombinase XerD